ncbi:hypothetical protein BHU62_03265 [Serratia marcescens]|uniref:DUF2975 domain-containing protein n=1 Tax=Serratia marcescens TaxID=615 RepID=A0A1Q4P4G6_SERMA|nr:DUF2975 domain-containing protein [Serratia marcescens]OKB68023.1 hypothetical protein BHU62_03265 [Serratia marcescens]
MRVISHSHKVQIRLCRGMEIMLLFLMGTLPVVCGYLLFWPASDGQSFSFDTEIEWTSGDNITFIVDNLVTFLVLLQMFIFSKGIRNGELFTKKRIRNVRNIGLILVLGYCFTLFIRIFFDSSLDEWNTDYVSVASSELYSLQQLLLGWGVLSLSYIFEKGKELEEERELVI